MPPSRKQKRNKLHKPSDNYSHPSLSLRAGATQHRPGTPTSRATPDSVNDRLKHLRLTQGHRPSPHIERALEDQCLHASMYTPSPVPRRRHAGPPPPLSWTTHAKRPASYREETSRISKKELTPLPDLAMPKRISLLHQALKTVATNFDWFITYYDPTTLSDRMKQQILTYVACFGSDHGISIDDMNLLFIGDGMLGEEAAEATKHITHLDLGGSLGRGFSMKRLDRYWTHPPEELDKATKYDHIPDSWDQDVSLGSPWVPLSLRFPMLTHLSLSGPSLSVKWTEFVTFSRHLGSLTHLSLDYWPAPRFDGAMPQSHPSTSTGKESGRGGDLEQEDEEASYLLKTLSRNTSSLVWLSVVGCQRWWPALEPRRLPEDLQSAPELWPLPLYDEDDRVNVRPHVGPLFGPDWTGAWQHLCHLRLGQGWLPCGIDSHRLGILVYFRSMARQGSAGDLTERPSRLIFKGNLVAYSDNEGVRRTMREADRLHSWLVHEHEALMVAGSIRFYRAEAQLPRCFVDFGWGREEALAAGYSEEVVFGAGL